MHATQPVAEIMRYAAKGRNIYDFEALLESERKRWCPPPNPPRHHPRPLKSLSGPWEDA